MLELRRSLPDHPDALRLTEQVQQYYAQLYGGPDTDPLPAQDFVWARGGFLVGYLDGDAVAMGGWTSVFDRDHPAAKIRRMYVAPTARRQGYAARLLAALEDDAAAAGKVEMLLTTGRPQAAAVALYRASGYAEVPAFGYYAATGGAVHLGKRLAPDD